MSFILSLDMPPNDNWDIYSITFWLYEQANPNTNKLLLESISNSSYDLVSLLLLILYIMKYKPMRALVLPAINFQVLKSFECTYMFYLLCN